MNLKKLKQLNIPKSPGCYKFKDKNSEIIYIGKASDLRSRILSYWRKSAEHSPAKYSMLKQVEKVKWIETDSEIEAMLLEANLIKKYQPQYNVVFRDDKRFIYIKIATEDNWPRISITRKLDKSGKYFGPFASTEAVKQTLRAIRKIWPFRTCARLPKKTCLYYRINKCPGMCENKISSANYNKIIQQIIYFLAGKKNKIIRKIKEQIKNHELKMHSHKIGSVKYNNLQDKFKYLKYQLFNLNKTLEYTNILSLGEKYATDVVELAKLITLPRVPQRIEGYDISNIFGKQAVGSMVVFSQGEANKNEYRKFKIKIGQGEANDVRMLKEVLLRRFNNDWPQPDLIIIDGAKAQLNTTLRVLKKIKLKIPTIAISKNKGLRSANAPDKLFFPGEKKPLELPLASPALHLIKRVRDEAHRFAISYHRQLRKKRLKI